MFKRFNKPYFIWWLLAVAFLVFAKISMRNGWNFSVNYQDVSYIVGYGLVFDLLAFIALIIGATLFFKARRKK